METLSRSGGRWPRPPALPAVAAAYLLLGAPAAEAADPRVRAAWAAPPEVHCLAEAVYREARGEGPTGMVAVAAVVMNRAAAGGRSVCGVVHERSAGGLCQFSWSCWPPGRRATPVGDSWRESLAVARAVLSPGASITDPTGGARFFSACRENQKGHRIGQHCFRGPGNAGPPPWAPEPGSMPNFVFVRGATVELRELAPPRRDARVAGVSHGGPG